jgi:hypothetical protein
VWTVLAVTITVGCNISPYCSRPYDNQAFVIGPLWITTVSFIVPVRPSVSMEQLDSRWTDIAGLLKSVEQIQVRLKSDKNKRKLTRWTACSCDVTWWGLPLYRRLLYPPVRPRSPRILVSVATARNALCGQSELYDGRISDCLKSWSMEQMYLLTCFVPFVSSEGKRGHSTAN